MSRLPGAVTDPRVRTFLGVAFRGRTYLNLLYLGLAFPLGLLYLLAVLAPVAVVAAPATAIGGALGVVVGLAALAVVAPLVVAGLGVGLVLSSLERRLASLLLDVEIEPGRVPDGESVPRRVRAVLTDRATWTSLAYLPTKFPFGAATLLLLATALPTGASMVSFPLYYGRPGLYVGIVTERPLELHPNLYVGWHNLLVGFETVVTVGWWAVATLPAALLAAALGVVLCLGTFHAVNGLARLAGWYARAMLGGAVDAVDAARRVLDGVDG